MLVIKTESMLSMIYNCYFVKIIGSPGSLVVKNPPANAGDLGSIPGQGRSPGEGNGYPRQWGFPSGSAVKNLPAMQET